MDVLGWVIVIKVNNYLFVLFQVYRFGVCKFYHNHWNAPKVEVLIICASHHKFEYRQFPFYPKLIPDFNSLNHCLTNQLGNFHGNFEIN